MTQGVLMMLKPELIEILQELLSIGGNQDISKSMELRNRLREFLSQDDQLFCDHDNANVVMAKDAIRFIDANNAYANNTNVAEANAYLNSFFERLLKEKKWSYYELELFIGSSFLTESVEQAIRLAIEAIINCVNFYDNSRIGILEGILSANICARILHAKYFDDIDDKFYLSKEFKDWFARLRHLTKEHSELELSNLVTKIRHALSEKNEVQIPQYVQELENKYSVEIVNLMNREIHFYMTSKRYFHSNHEPKGGEL